MKSRSNTEIRRARPLLGTIVDLACHSSPDEIDCAFAAIEKVHRLMSFHDPASDVSRINREAFYRKVIVDAWTWRVLNAAQEFSRVSNGIFDITVARELAKWNYLPQSYRVVGEGNWRDIVLEKNCAIRFRRRLIVDLGGIAKGFAVDCAVEALQRAGVSSGIVNAGGDLRVFGSKSELVHLRCPNSPTQFSGTLRVRDRAVATSALYFSPVGPDAPLVDGKTRRGLTSLISVSVAAADCITADALTKIVFALRERAAPLLMRHGADALLLERDGSPRWIAHAT